MIPLTASTPTPAAALPFSGSVGPPKYVLPLFLASASNFLLCCLFKHASWMHWMSADLCRIVLPLAIADVTLEVPRTMVPPCCWLPQGKQPLSSAARLAPDAQEVWWDSEQQALMMRLPKQSQAVPQGRSRRRGRARSSSTAAHGVLNQAQRVCACCAGLRACDATACEDEPPGRTAHQAGRGGTLHSDGDQGFFNGGKPPSNRCRGIQIHMGFHIMNH